MRHPAIILSHCLLGNTLKIHPLGIVWIWDFPLELLGDGFHSRSGVEEEEEEKEK